MAGITDKIKGKVKEMTGKASGDRRTETEGQTDQFKGDVKQKAEAVEQRAKGVADSLDKEVRSERAGGEPASSEPGRPAGAGERAGPTAKPSRQP